MFDCDQGPLLTAVRLGARRNRFGFHGALARGPNNPRPRTIAEPVPFQEERRNCVTLRSQTKQNGMVLIVRRVTWNIRPEKCKDGKAGVVEEKIPIMTCTKEERSTGAAPPFFRFAMRIVKGASLNQTQKAVRTVIWHRCHHAMRSALDYIVGQQTVAVTNGR